MQGASRNVRLLIGGDYSLVQQALTERLDRETGLYVVAGSLGADELVQAVREVGADVILMDVDSPRLRCFQTARRIRSAARGTRILFFAATARDRHIEQAISVRANGFLTTRASQEAFITAIREAARGGNYFSDDVRKRLLLDDNGKPVSTIARSRRSRLTRRESEALEHIARGLSQKQMAAQMHISIKTVEKHVTHLMKKLDIHDRVELARFAIREGMVEP